MASEFIRLRCNEEACAREKKSSAVFKVQNQLEITWKRLPRHASLETHPV